MKKHTSGNKLNFKSGGSKKTEVVTISRDDKTLNKDDKYKLAEAEVDEIQEKYKNLKKKLKKLRKENNDPQADLTTLKYLLESTQDLIPASIETIKKYNNDRSVYSNVALVNQVRELMADIRQQSNGAKQVDYIVNKILRPDYQQLLQLYLTDCANFKKHLSKLPRKRRDALNSHMDDMMRNYGILMNNIQNKTTVALNEYLVGK